MFGKRERGAPVGESTLRHQALDERREPLRRKADRAAHLLARRAGAQRLPAVSLCAQTQRVRRERLKRRTRRERVTERDDLAVRETLLDRGIAFSCIEATAVRGITRGARDVERGEETNERRRRGPSLERDDRIAASRAHGSDVGDDTAAERLGR